MTRETISQLSVDENLPDAQNGQILSNKGSRQNNAPHSNGASAQVSEVQFPDTPSADTTYQFTFEGEVIEFTSGSSPTTASVAEKAKTAFEANIVAYGIATASIDGSDNLELTARDRAGTFDVSTSDANLSVVEVTSASEESDVGVGLAVFWDGDDVSLDASGLGVTNSNFNDYFAGITRQTYDTESREPYSTDDAPYKPSEQVQFLTRGQIYVVTGDNASRGDAAWIGTDADERGQIFTSDNAGTTRIQAPKDILRWVDSNLLEVQTGY